MTQRRPPPKSPPKRPPPRTDAPGADRYSADLVVVLGAPETGKSAHVKRLVESERRLLVWDPCDEYRRQACRRVSCLADLQRALIAAGAGPARLAYLPGSQRDEFEGFCRLAWAWSQEGRADRAPCCVVVEELADVVPPGRAPPPWGVLLRRGRHRGIKVRAVGHSPREIDKTTLRMATLWHVHALGHPSDRKYMADVMGADQAALDRLAAFDFAEVRRSDLSRSVVLGRTLPV